MILKSGIEGIPRESKVLQIIQNHELKDDLLIQVQELKDDKRKYFIVYFEERNIYYPRLIVCEVRKSFYNKYRGERFRNDVKFMAKYYKINLWNSEKQ